MRRTSAQGLESTDQVRWGKYKKNRQRPDVPQVWY